MLFMGHSIYLCSHAFEDIRDETAMGSTTYGVAVLEASHSTLTFYGTNTPHGHTATRHVQRVKG